jgi:hypothetical protein
VCFSSRPRSTPASTEPLSVTTLSTLLTHSLVLSFSLPVHLILPLPLFWTTSPSRSRYLSYRMIRALPYVYCNILQASQLWQDEIVHSYGEACKLSCKTGTGFDSRVVDLTWGLLNSAPSQRLPGYSSIFVPLTRLTYFTPLFEYERRCQYPRVTLLRRPYRTVTMTYLPHSEAT